MNVSLVQSRRVIETISTLPLWDIHAVKEFKSPKFAPEAEQFLGTMPLGYIMQYWLITNIYVHCMWGVCVCVVLELNSQIDP